MQRSITVGLTALMLMLTMGLAFGETAMEQRYPNVIDVNVSASGGDRFNFQVTLSSPYDTPQRYADAFKIMTEQEETLGVRELLHDHASEQPFTRGLSGVSISPDITRVVVKGRDQQYGYGGKTITVAIPGR